MSNDKGRSAIIHCNAVPSLKTAAIRSCAQGESLNDFIEAALLKHIKSAAPDVYEEFKLDARIAFERNPKLPRWTKGLSYRTAEALIKEGFSGKVSVRKAAQEGFDFSQVPNLAPRHVQEIESWL